MLSNREIKWIQSLKNKKYRYKERAYLAEGPRLVNELISNGAEPLLIAATPDYILPDPRLGSLMRPIDSDGLKKISGLVTPNEVLAVFAMPESTGPEEHPAGSWGFALDSIQDPGNLGTIMRTLDWLGITRLYCSIGSVDVYNPKVVQASMGAIGSIAVSYVDLPSFLKKQDAPCYAADAGGVSIKGLSIPPGIIVLGNEGNGLSEEVRAECSMVLAIPKSGGGESLNVAVSAAILAAWTGFMH